MSVMFPYRKKLRHNERLHYDFVGPDGTKTTVSLAFNFVTIASVVGIVLKPSFSLIPPNVSLTYINGDHPVVTNDGMAVWVSTGMGLALKIDNSVPFVLLRPTDVCEPGLSCVLDLWFLPEESPIVIAD